MKKLRRRRMNKILNALKNDNVSFLYNYETGAFRLIIVPQSMIITSQNARLLDWRSRQSRDWLERALLEGVASSARNAWRALFGKSDKWIFREKFDDEKLREIRDLVLKKMKRHECLYIL